jgi:hypothetical protein
MRCEASTQAKQNPCSSAFMGRFSLSRFGRTCGRSIGQIYMMEILKPTKEEARQ